MERKRTNVFLVVMAVLLLQFILPVFDSVPVCSTENSHNALMVHSGGHSAVLPTFLKEKEESEGEVEAFGVEFFQIIDFSDHTSLMSKFHNVKIMPFTFRDRINYRPLLFSLNSVYII